MNYPGDQARRTALRGLRNALASSVAVGASAEPHMFHTGGSFGCVEACSGAFKPSTVRWEALMKTTCILLGAGVLAASVLGQDQSPGYVSQPLDARVDVGEVAKFQAVATNAHIFFWEKAEPNSEEWHVWKFGSLPATGSPQVLELAVPTSVQTIEKDSGSRWRLLIVTRDTASERFARQSQTVNLWVNDTNTTAVAIVCGGVVAWGQNDGGQVVPPPLTTDGVIGVAAGLVHSLALLRDGSVVAWGSDFRGQSSIPGGRRIPWSGNPENKSDRAATHGLSDVVAIAAGAWHSMALTRSGDLISWGWGAGGRSGLKAISGGGAHSLVLTSSGSAEAFSVATPGGYYSQTVVPALATTGVKAIAAGQHYNIALKEDGTIVTWGLNDAGQLQPRLAAPLDRTGVSCEHFAKACGAFQALRGIKQIAAGDRHGLALGFNGTLYAWGDDTFGQLSVPGASGIDAIAANGAHSLILTKQGEVLAWGLNQSGQLNVPGHIQGRAKAIAAGSLHSLAIVDTGGPRIFEHPVSVCGSVGAPASLTVRVDGPGPFTYAWFRNGEALVGKTNSTLLLASLTAADAGRYWASVSNSCGGQVSESAAISVRPVITGQPGDSLGSQDLAVNYGVQTNLSVAAEGAPIVRYQWLKGGVAMPAEQAPILRFPFVTEWDGGTYTVTISNACGAVISRAVNLCVRPGLRDSMAFRTIDLAHGGSEMLAPAVVGSPPLTFQWRRDGQPLAGENQNRLILDNVGAEDAGVYSLVVSNRCGWFETNVAAVRIRPYIVQHPTNQVVVLGNTATNFVEARGSQPLSYQWYKNGLPIAGATAAIYRNAPDEIGSVYWVVVTNHAGLAQSQIFQLYLTFGAPAFIVQPTNQVVSEGDTLTLRAVAAPATAGDYTWFHQGTRLMVPSNSVVQIPNVSAAQEGDYRAIVRNLGGSATSAVATVTVRTVPTIVDPSLPEDATVVAGAPHAFRVRAVGTAPLRYQWFKDRVPIPGATSAILSIPAASVIDVGTYSVTVTNLAGAAASRAATLNLLGPPTLDAIPVSQVAVEGTNVDFSVSARSTTPMDYQWFFQGRPVGGNRPSLSVFGVDSSDAGQYWVSVRNSVGSTSSPPASLAVLTAPRLVVHPVDQLVPEGATAFMEVAAESVLPLSYQWFHNGEALPGKTRSILPLYGVSGREAGAYRARVSNGAGSVLSRSGVLSLAGPPTDVQISSLQPIYGWPTNSVVVVVEGQTLFLSAQAEGTRPMRYQWTFNGGQLTGETSSTLVRSNITAAQSGYYAVYCANNAGGYLSPAVRVHVIPVGQGAANLTGFTVTSDDLRFGWSPALKENGVYVDSPNNLLVPLYPNTTRSFTFNVNGGPTRDVERFLAKVLINQRVSDVDTPPAFSLTVARDRTGGTPGVTGNTSFVTAQGIPVLITLLRISSAVTPPVDVVSDFSLEPDGEEDYVGQLELRVGSPLREPGVWDLAKDWLAGDITSSMTSNRWRFFGNIPRLGREGYYEEMQLFQQPWRGEGLEAWTLWPGSSAGIGLNNQPRVAFVDSALLWPQQVFMSPGGAGGGVSVAFEPKVSGVYEMNGTLHRLVESELGDGVDYYVERGAVPVLAGTLSPGSVQAPIQVSEIELRAGELLHLIVSGRTQADDITGVSLSVRLLREIPSPPEVRGAPVSQTLLPGSTGHFAVETSGWPAPSYQWRFYGMDLPGQTNQHLWVTNLTSAESGWYSVVVRNTEGVVEAPAAYLGLKLSATNILATASSEYPERWASNVVGSDPLKLWMSAGINLATGAQDRSPHITFDLRSSKLVDSIGLVNSPEGGRAVRRARVAVSLDGAQFLPVRDIEITNGTSQVQAFSLEGIEARFVRLEILENFYGITFPTTRSTVLDNGYVSLSKAEFFTRELPRPPLEAAAQPGGLALHVNGPLGATAIIETTDALVGGEWRELTRFQVDWPELVHESPFVPGEMEQFYRLRFVPTVRLTESLLAYYPFDGDMQDASGNSRHLQGSGQALVTDRLGRPGSAVQVSQVSNVRVTGLDPDEYADGFSFGAWIKMDQYGGYPLHWEGTFLGWLAPKYLLFRFGSPGALEPGIFRLLETNQWHHLLLTHGSTKNRLFLNGFPSYEWPSTGLSGNFDTLTLGYGSPRASLDDVVVYGKELSADEVLALYRGGLGSLSEVPPSFVSQPISQSLGAGAALDLSVAVIGSRPLSFQWRRDGVPLVEGPRVQGVAGSRLRIDPIESSDAGLYDVIVANTYGRMTSQAATVAVVVLPPSITEQPRDQALPPGATALFSVRASGSPPLTFQWRQAGNALLSGARINGATSPNLAISNLGPSDLGDYDVIVSNPQGSVTSVVAKLSMATRAVRLTNVSVTATSELSSHNRLAAFVTDGSFREDDSLSSVNGVWESSGIGFAGQPEKDDRAPALTFDLNGRYGIQEMQIWNFPEASVAVKDFALEYSVDGQVFSPLSVVTGLNQSDITVVKVPVPVARYIRFRILENWGGTKYPVAPGSSAGGFYGFAGLSEVVFIGSPQ